jgi:uncharacterized membrane protein (UPF0127 family)
MLNKIFLILLLTIFWGLSAQPKFKTGTLEIGDKKIKIEIARSDEQRSYGLMNRTRLDENSGMLFIFQKEQHLSFWMKNTLIPLSIGFFDRNQRLVDVQEMVPFTEKSMTYVSKKPALYALEMNKGWFEKNKIQIGSKFTFTENKD